jgi:hypothetical protein
MLTPYDGGHVDTPFRYGHIAPSTIVKRQLPAWNGGRNGFAW